MTGASLETLRSFSFNPGDLLMLTAVALWAAYGVFSRSKGQRFQPIVLTFYSFVVCVLFLLPFVLFEQPWAVLGSLRPATWTAILYMSVFPSVIGYLSQQVAIKRIGPGNASMFINLVPLFSILLSVVLLNEALEPVKLFTGALIVAGVVICQSAKR